MGGPGEVTADGDTQVVLAGNCRLFPVFAHGGSSWMSGLFFACHVAGLNADDVAFHLPGVFPPFSKSVKVFSVEVRPGQVGLLLQLLSQAATNVILRVSQD